MSFYLTDHASEFPSVVIHCLHLVNSVPFRLLLLLIIIIIILLSFDRGDPGVTHHIMAPCNAVLFPHVLYVMISIELSTLTVSLVFHVLVCA